MEGDEGLDASTPDAAEELSALRARYAALEINLREARESADQRAMASELRAEALRRGMVDLDGLKLIEGGGVSVDAEGVVHGAATVMTKLRRDKPWLFGASNSSSVAGVPIAAPLRTKLATEMTLQEWRVARADLVRRR